MTDRGRFNVNRFTTLSGDGLNFELVVPVEFTRSPQVGGERIVIPAGATSDGASTPAALWAIGFPPFGDHFRAAFVHDAIFRRQTLEPIDDFDKANLIFLEAMLTCGVPYDKARWFYNGVCEGGRKAWNEDRTLGVGNRNVVS